MKIGIDSYCYHRLFGEVYPGQDQPVKIITFEMVPRSHNNTLFVNANELAWDITMRNVNQT